MAKYVLKESELRSVINDIVTEELTNSLDEGVLQTVGKIAAGLTVPTFFLQKGIQKVGGIINGNDNLTGGSSSSGRRSRSERRSRAYQAAKEMSWEYGKPETIPGHFGKDKLAPKSEIVAPQITDRNILAALGGNQIQWGSFGSHYHDINDKMWNNKVNGMVKTIARNARNENQRKRFIAIYRRRLAKWLRNRDKAYFNYFRKK